MKNKLIKTITLLSLLSLTGCSLSLSTDGEKNEELERLRDMGIIAYEESTLGIPIDEENITENLISGHYYICHDNVLYPCYADYQTYDEIEEYEARPAERFDIYTSESVINIPTLFEGDKLYYYNDTGILMFSTFERMKDLGWSIGLRNLQSTPAGYVYIDLENEGDGYKSIMDSLSGMRNIASSSILVDKIGGVRLTSDLCENGIINGLIEGVKYDLEVYNGTQYYYYDAVVDTRYFQSYEVYALDKYIPLQDYLYEIEIPEYLPQGYYDIDALGMFRYVKGTQYSDDTDFNERLLYEYDNHMEGDYSLSENKAPAIYSENPLLCKYRAYDEGVFGYEQTRVLTYEEEMAKQEEESASENTAMSEIGLANFIAASKTTTDVYLPVDKEFSITIESEESTGSISLQFENGKTVKLPYDRIAKTYSYTGKGSGGKGTIEVKGLYSDYTIKLRNASTKPIATETAE